MAQVDFLEQNKLSFIVFWETKKNDPRPSNGNQKSNKMTLVMHYGIRITTKVYKKLDTNLIQYIIDALTR